MAQKDSELLPIGDIEFLNHLAAVASLAAAKDLVASAPGAVAKELKTIRLAIETEDSVLLKEACHALRGACYSVQVSRLAHMTKEMEDRSRDIERARRLLLPLEEVGGETIAWWHDILEKDLIQA
ncbi:MAG: Hpt domain-containing protein [Sneathiella sp.]